VCRLCVCVFVFDDTVTAQTTTTRYEWIVDCGLLVRDTVIRHC
jgi:hypothetical protein